MVWRALNSPDGARSEKLQNSLERGKPSRGQESDGIPGKKTQHDIIMGIDPKELWARTTDRVTAEF